MKAKEYIARYKDTYEKDPTGTLTDILLALRKEMFDLVEKRGVKTDAGFLGCFREIRQKWYAIYPAFKYGEKYQFDLMIKSLSPELYVLLGKRIEMESFS